MGGKKQKKPGMEKNSSTSTSTTDETPTKRVPNLLFFLLVGLIVILTFTSLHLLFSGLICFILGLDFLTVIYVTAAAITTGSVLTIALTFLVSLYCVLTFFASMHASSTPSSLLQQRQDLSAAQLKNLVATTSAAPAPGDVKSN